MVSVFVYLFSK